MRNTNTRRPTRLLAAFMVVLMVFSLLPVQAFAGGSSVTVTVQDIAGTPLEEAAVSYSMLDEGGTVLRSDTVKTAAGGTVALSIPGGAKTYSYSVSKEGYETATGSKSIENTSITVKLAFLAVEFSASANTGLIYTGNPQTLVAVTGLTEGATVQFAVCPKDTELFDVTEWTDKAEATDAGEYTVWVKGTKVGLANTFQSFYVPIGKADIPNFTLEAKDAKDLVYTGNTLPLVKELSIDGVTVTYAVTTENTKPEDGAFGAYSTAVGKDVGTYYVWAKGVPTDTTNYKVAYANVLVEITKGKPADFEITAKKDLTYQDDGTVNSGVAQALIEAVSVENADVYYTVTDTEKEEADLDAIPVENWKESVPQGTDAGVYRVWVRVIPKDTNNYDPVIKYKDVTIDKQKVTNLSICYTKESYAEDTTAGWKATVPVAVRAGAELSETIPYKFHVKVVNETLEANVGTITNGSTANPTLTIQYPGEYTVSLVLDEDNYTCDKTEKALFAKTLNNVWFENDEAVNYTLANNGTPISTRAAVVDDGNNIKTITYALKTTEDEAVPETFGFAVSDAGVVTVSDLEQAIKDVGTSGLSFKVVATSAENEFYPSATASYTINVSLASAPEPVLSADATKEIEEITWYGKGFKVTAEGYTCYNGFGEDGKLKKSVTEGVHTNEDWYFVNDSTHEISTAPLTYAYDVTAPVVGEIKIGYDALQTLESVIFFDITGKGNTKAQVSVTVTDAGVGVDSVVVNAAAFGGELPLTDDDKNGTYTAEVALKETAPDDDKFAVTVEDALGNKVTKNTYKTSDEQDAYLRVAAGKPVYSVDVTPKAWGAQEVVITVEDPYFNKSGVKAIATIIDYDIFTSDDVAEKELPLYDSGWSAEGNVHTYKYEYSYTELLKLSGLWAVNEIKVKVDYTNDLNVDILAEPPAEDSSSSVDITMSYEKDGKLVNLLSGSATHYITSSTDPQITISDELFDDDMNNGSFNITVEKDSADYTASVQFPAWTANGNEHTLDVPLNDDGEYVITVVFTDAGEETPQRYTYTSDKIVVDNTKPTVSVAYDPDGQGVVKTPVEVSEGIYDYYFNGNIKATVTVEDKNCNDNGMTLTVTKDGAPYSVSPSSWQGNENKRSCSFLLEDDGEYKVEIKYADLAGNELASDYSSEKLIRDTSNPTVDVKYNVSGESTAYGTAQKTVGTKHYYNGNITATVTVDDKNFNADGMKLKVNGVEQTVSKDAWVSVPETNKHTYTYTLSEDGDYIVSIDYQDLATNSASKYTSETLVRDTVKPVIDVKYNVSGDSDAYGTAQKTVGTKHYYNGNITATVTVDELNFDANGMTLTATKNGAKYVIPTADVSAWQSVSGEGNENKHTCTVTFKDDGDYTLGIAYTDLATNPLASDYASETLVRDTVKPVIDVKYNVSGDSTAYETAINSALISSVTKYFYDGDITATVTVDELNFDADGMTLTVTKDGEACSVSPTEWKAVAGTNKHTCTFTLTEDGEYNISIACTDLATNPLASDYASAPIIKDTVAPVVTIISEPVLTYDDIEASKTATLAVTVTEINFDTANSYVKVYKTNAKGAANDEYGNAILVKDAGDWIKNDDGTYTATIELTAEGCYKAELDVIDFAKHQNADATLNGITEGAPVRVTGANPAAPAIKFVLDATEPELTWELAEGFAPHSVSKVGTPNGESFGYFKWWIDKDKENKDVTMTDAAIILVATDEFAGVEALHYAYYIANNVSGVNKGNQNNTKAEKDGKTLVFEDVAIAEIEDIEFENGFESGFDTDGKMTAIFKLYIPREALTANNQFNGYLEFYATDLAQNENTAETAKVDPLNTESDALKNGDDEFTRIVVDSINPNVTLTLNAPVNTDNGIDYYNGDINVSIVVREANFYKEDITASVNGGGVYLGWGGDTDNHFANYTITGDGEYKTAVAYAGDRSGNPAYGNFQSGDMVIDTKIEDPIITVNGADANGKAFKGNAVLGVKFEDENFDRYEIKVTRTVKGEKDKDVTAQFINKTIPTTKTGGEATFDTFDKIQENDGIYTVTVTMYDKALHKSSATSTFSINRFGSVYEYSDVLADLIKDGGQYVQEVPADLVIKEFNPDRLVADSVKINITRDGKPVSDVKYTATPVTNDLAAGESGWYEYAYTINKSNFAEDGVYTVSVTSQDIAGNTPENTNYADMGILFYVDHTAPELTNVTGLENTIINAAEQDVNYSVFENIALASVVVYVDGEKVAEITDFTADRNSFNDVVKLYEKDSAQNVRFVLTDVAGNVTDTADEAFFAPEAVAARFYTMNPDVTVSTKWTVRWYANKPLFYGTVIGGAAALGIVFFLIFGRKKKEDKEESKAKA